MKTLLLKPDAWIWLGRGELCTTDDGTTTNDDAGEPFLDEAETLGEGATETGVVTVVEHGTLG